VMYLNTFDLVVSFLGLVSRLKKRNLKKWKTKNSKRLERSTKLFFKTLTYAKQ
jgi:hypothetical protein